MKTLRFVALATAATFCLPAQEGGKPKTGTPAEAAAKGAPVTSPLVGVVDLVKAIDQYPKWIKLRGELEATAESVDGELKNMNKSINELKAALEFGSDDERKVKELQYQGMFQQREAWVKLQRDRIDMKRARALLTVYEDLEVAIAKVAKARGVAIVLRLHNMGPSLGDPSKLPDRTVVPRVEAFERREVLYAAADVDLTDDLIKLLMVPLAEPKDGAKDAAGPAKDAAKPSPEKAPDTPKKTGG